MAGIEYDDYGRLWAAGGTGGEVRVYDSESGELLETYPFEAGFLNDVAATPDAVYVTDSFVPQVIGHARSARTARCRHRRTSCRSAHQR